MNTIQEQAIQLLERVPDGLDGAFVGSLAEMSILRYAEDGGVPIDQQMLDLLGVSADECTLAAETQDGAQRTFLLETVTLIDAMKAEVYAEMQAVKDDQRIREKEERRARAESAVQHEQEKKAKRPWWKKW